MWSIRIRSWHRMWSGVAAAFALVVGCGDDDGDDGVVDTTGTATISTTEAASSSEESTTSGADGSSSSTGEGSTGTTGEESSGGADTTTGASGDPAYPPTDGGGACPPGTAPIQLPGASLCGPFCAGADAECPPPASGDAVPTCTPFEEKGGSGTPCRTHDECPEGEACDTDGTCVAVAFWACRLVCDAGQTCSDDMTCAAGACGYP